jgi:predicted alpha/beta hydrolase family esterase
MRYVFLAGIGNSEPEHWQSLWYRSLPPDAARWVEHADWDRPVAAEWVADLDAVLTALPGPKLLVAHSMGCLLAVEWAKRHRDPEVRGAFLVSVPDVTGPCFPTQAIGFAPAAEGRPPLPALLVASTDDRYCGIDHARGVARAWGVRLVDVGTRGHINLASNIGAWDEGRRLLEAFAAGVGAPPIVD